MNRISLHISSLVKHCNSVSKLILLIVLTGCISGAYADVTISTNTTHSSAYNYPGNVTLNKDRTLTINSKVTIKGNLTCNGTIVIGAGGSLTVEGNVTINNNSNWRLTNANAKLIVKGDVMVNEEKEFKINEGGGPEVESTYSGVIVVQGSMKVDQKAKVRINNNSVVIIEGDLVLTAGNNGKKNDAEIHVDHSACVTIKKQISGTGRITIHMPDGGHQGNNGYLAVLGYNEDGSQGSNGLGINANKIKIESKNSETDFLYIEGVASIGGTTTNNKGVNSAYAKSLENMAAAGAAGLLPIELTSFTVSPTEYGYTFNWVTASEENNDYFTLEYSIDGVDFNEIDYVHGAGTTSETSEYEYRWDEAPEFDVVYFRLKQTDYNGEYSYSDVIVASRKKSSGANGTFRYGPLNMQIQDGELRYIVK